MMFFETPPNETEINHCLTQMLTDGVHVHSESSLKYAKMRLADCTHSLNQWNHADFAQKIGQTPLPKVDKALRSGTLTPEQGAKLLTFLQQHAQENQSTTALLYLSYLHAKGLFTTQSLKKAAAFAHQAAKKGDWRGHEWLAEMLLTVPEAAPELFGQTAKPIAQTFHENHPHLSSEDIQAACKRFYNHPHAIKQLIRKQFQTAAEQGSPHAEQQIRKLIVQGQLPPSPPAKQYGQLAIWLDFQFPSTSPSKLRIDRDINLFPDNLPFLPPNQAEPAWWISPKIQLLLIICFGLIFLTWLSAKMLG